MGFGLDDLWLVQRLKTQGLLPDPVAVAEIGAQQVNKSILLKLHRSLVGLN